MQNWFETKIKYVRVDDDGRERKVSEVYLVDSLSCTEAEARLVKEMEQVIRGDSFITKVSTSNVVEIFAHETGEWWWKVKIGIVTIDEKAGKEKLIANYFLVNADDLKQALQRTEEGLAYVLVPYHIDSIVRSNIMDVYPYFSADQLKAGIPNNLSPIEKIDEV